MNLLRIVHPMLRTKLRTALFRAKQVGTQVIVSGVPLEIAGVHKTIDLRVSPAQDLASDFLLVVFDAKEEVVPSETFTAGSVEPLMQQLESHAFLRAFPCPSHSTTRPGFSDKPEALLMNFENHRQPTERRLTAVHQDVFQVRARTISSQERSIREIARTFRRVILFHG